MTTDNDVHPLIPTVKAKEQPVICAKTGVELPGATGVIAGDRPHLLCKTQLI